MWFRALAFMVTSFAGASASAQTINNASFAEWAGEKPAGWTVRANKQRLIQAADADHPTASSALRVDLIRDAGSSYGEILQKLKLEPYTRYRISGDIRSSRNGLGIYQVKTIRAKNELERLSSDRSTTQWKTVAIEFDTQGADEVQILCRYNQKGENVGESIWWTALQIERLGSGEAPPDPDKLVIAESGQEQFVTPMGAGARSGESWENARGADELQAALDAAGPGDTVHIGSGTYPRVSLKLERGGRDGEGRVTVRGVDTGGGLPRFVSDFDRERPASTGGLFLRIDPYVGFVTIQDIRLEGFGTAVVMHGPNRGVRLINIDSERCREGIIVNGGAVPGAYDSGTNDLVVRDCDFRYYTKRGIRIRGGVHDAQIVNCHADAGGEEWAVESFPMGFTVEGSKAEGIVDHDITYRGCTSRNNWHKNGDKYWNADGFAAERRTERIAYIDCGAFGNTDGGWDIKSISPTFVNCVALDNKRNFRIWSKPEGPARMENCLAAYSRKRGGTGNANGIHLSPGAAAIIDRVTVVESGTGIDLDTDGGRQTAVRVSRSIVYVPDGTAFDADGSSATVAVTDSVVIDAENAGGDPRFVDPSPGWKGGSSAFDSKAYADHGYRFGVSADAP